MFVHYKDPVPISDNAICVKKGFAWVCVPGKFKPSSWYTEVIKANQEVKLIKMKAKLRSMCSPLEQPLFPAQCLEISSQGSGNNWPDKLELAG